MAGETMRRARPALKALVGEASRALALMDAPRLEELADACQALNRYAEPGYLQSLAIEVRARLAEEAQQALDEMAIFARVLEVTRANLKVLHRLRELRMKPLVYSERQARGCQAMECGSGISGSSTSDSAESGHGHD
jgi:hypothetical protein